MNRAWIKWAGGACPVTHNAYVDIRYDDGVEEIGIHAGTLAMPCNGIPDDWWRHEGCDGEHIVAYRLAGEEQMINAEEIAKLPPLKRIKPLALALAYDFIPYAVALALALLLAAAAHAAIHTDKPTQETTPVASKEQAACFQSNAVVTFLRDEQGNWHRLTVYGPIEPCGH